MLWYGGSDELIQCSHAAAREKLTHVFSFERLAGLHVDVEDREILYDHITGYCDCNPKTPLLTPTITVNSTMTSLAHEYLEFIFFDWHGSAGGPHHVREKEFFGWDSRYQQLQFSRCRM